jgi:hypothetical protein
MRQQGKAVGRFFTVFLLGVSSALQQQVITFARYGTYLIPISLSMYRLLLIGLGSHKGLQ